MSDSAVDKAIFAFLGSCVGDFVQWPQCSIVALRSRNEGGRPDVLFKAAAMNPDYRTVFWIIVTKDDEWRGRIIQLSNHVRFDGVDADLDFIVCAVNRFRELAGMVEGGDHD